MTREELIEKLKTQLDEWNQDIDRLEAKVDEATGPAREKANAQLDKAKAAARDARAKLEQLKSAGESSFESMKDEAVHVWKTFRSSVKYFKSQL